MPENPPICLELPTNCHLNCQTFQAPHLLGCAVTPWLSSGSAHKAPLSYKRLWFSPSALRAGSEVHSLGEFPGRIQKLIDLDGDNLTK